MFCCFTVSYFSLGMFNPRFICALRDKSKKQVQYINKIVEAGSVKAEVVELTFSFLAGGLCESMNPGMMLSEQSLRTSTQVTDPSDTATASNGCSFDNKPTDMVPVS